MMNKLEPNFTRHVLILMTGTTIAQAIPIAISPILTRLYSPENFGILSLYLSLVTIFSVVATARYELAVLLPEKEVDAVNIIASSIFISLIMSGLLLLIVFFYNTEITQLLGAPSISPWLYFFPFTVFFISTSNNLNYWNTRKKEYLLLSEARVLQSATIATSNLSFGFMHFSNTGLVISSILGQLIITTKLGLNFLPYVNKISFSRMLYMSKKYIRFPKFSMPAGILNISAKEVPKILIANIFEISILGFFTLGQRMILLPIAIFSSSIQQVFFQQASEEYRKKANVALVYNKTLKKLFFIAIIPFSLLLLFSPTIFSFVFGDSWRMAGEIVRILTPFYFVYFIASPLNIMFTIVEAQRLELHWQTTFLILSVGSLIISSMLFDNVYIILRVFSFFNMLAFLYGLFLTRRLANG